MKKRFLGVIIAIIMVLGLVPSFAIAASAADNYAYPTSTPTATWTGSGTENDPYVITTAQQLADLAWFINNNKSAYYSKHYKLGNDIDLSGGTWTVIGFYDGSNASQKRGFKGIFDGNGKTISGLNNISTDHKTMALFGYLDGGTIKNLTVSGAFSSATSYSAGICAYSIGTIDNCINEVNITVSDSSIIYVGGVVGYANTSSATKGCTNKGNITSNGSGATNNVGGIAGNLGKGTIDGCENFGTVTVTASGDVGGICGKYTGGKTDSSIKNCKNFGAVSGKSIVGGIVGRGKGLIENSSNSGTITGTENIGGIGGYIESASSIKECYNIGNVTGTKYIGGISGYGDGNSGASTIELCYNEGTVKSSNTASNAQVYVGGIEGDSYGTVINNCYNIGNVQGGSSSSKYVGGISGYLQNNATVKNCFNSGTISSASSNYGTAIAYKSVGTITNCYFLSGKGTDTNATSKDSTAFSDGSVTKFLQSGNLELVWGQTINTDSYPVFYNGSNALGVDATGVTVDPTTVTVGVGKTVILTATVSPINANDKTVTWTSDNNLVATVANGVVTGVGKGTATITVTSTDGGFTATCTVTVCDHIGSTHTEYTTKNCHHTYTCTVCNLTLTDECTFDAASGICSVCDEYVAVVSVTVNESTTHYKDIVSAVAYIKDLSGSDAVKMQLTANSTSEDGIIFPAKKIEFDLNGKSITVKSIYYTTGADVTIKDSASEPTGKLLINYQHSINEGAKLTMNSGFVEGNFDCHYVEGTFVMTGGTFKSTLNAIQVEDANSEIIISGGTLDGGQYAIYRQASYHTSKITLSGGYFIGGVRSTSSTGYPLSNLLAEGYKFVDDDKNNVDETVDYLQKNLRVVIDHKHKWTYTADGDTITATCANTDGACGDAEQSIVIEAPYAGRGGLTFDNMVKAATISGKIEDVEIPEIVYTLKSTGEAASPFAPGVYVASITIGTATATCEFEIKKGSLSNTDFVYDSTTTVTYDGTGKSVSVTPAKAIETYVGAIEVLYGDSATLPINVGSYAISINVAESEYYTASTIVLKSGRANVTLTISAKEISDLTYNLPERYPLINGAATPDVTIQYNGMTLVKDTDYTLTYANNTTSETLATVTVNGIGNYSGTKELTFTVAPAHVHDYTNGTVGFSDENHWIECDDVNCPDMVGSRKNITEHTAGADDGDCTTPVLCSGCDYIVTAAKTTHEAGADDGDCTTAIICKHCTKVVTDGNATHTPELDDGDCTTDINCKNCTKVAVFGNNDHAPELDDGDCTTDIKCSICETVTTKGATTHTGGTATCMAKAKCDVCGKEYGDTTDHTHGTEWKNDADNHWNECACGDKDNVAAHADSNSDEKCDTCGKDMLAPSGGDEPGTDEPGTDDPNADNTADPTDETNGLDTGAIVAIAAGATVVGGAGIFALVWFVIKKKTWADFLAIFKKG